MLVYVADMLLGYLTYGPWKDPDGFNFPQTITFLPVTQVPLIAEGHRAHVGLFVALGRRRRGLAVSVPHLRRVPAGGRRAGAARRALRRLLGAPLALDGAA